MGMTPVVKWAGGKRQILDKLKANLPSFFNTYYEPFVRWWSFIIRFSS